MQEAEDTKEERMDRRSFGKNRMLCLLAGGFLFVGFLLCVFLPKAEYSDSERRRLAVLPRLSVEAIVGGQFMEDFESFTVDTFRFASSCANVRHGRHFICSEGRITGDCTTQMAL